MHPSLPFLSLSRFSRLIHGEKLNGFADRSLWWRFERSSKAFPSRSNSISYWIDRSIGEERNVLTRRLPPIRNEFHACTSSVLRVSCRPNFAGATSRNAGNDGRELQAELVERTVITRVRERGEGGEGRCRFEISAAGKRGREGGSSISRHASPIPMNGIHRRRYERDN